MIDIFHMRNEKHVNSSQRLGVWDIATTNVGILMQFCDQKTTQNQNGNIYTI